MLTLLIHFKNHNQDSLLHTVALQGKNNYFLTLAMKSLFWSFHTLTMKLQIQVFPRIVSAETFFFESGKCGNFHYGNFLLHKLNNCRGNCLSGEIIQGRKLFAKNKVLFKF